MTKKSDLKLSIIMSRLIHKILILDRSEKMCHGVTLSQHYVINTLYRKKRRTMNDLSKALGLAMSTTTRIVDILVRDGFVLRKSAVNDRRKVCVELSEKGIEKARELNSCTQAFWYRVFKSVPDDRKKEISQNLNEILHALNQVNGCCQTIKDQSGE